MQTPLRSIVRTALAGSCILAAVLSHAAYAAADTASAVQAVWQPVEIKYSYVGFTTAYNCDAFESKVKTILLTLGANPLTKVQANGCININRPSRNFFVTITTATPIAASEAKDPDNKATAELTERLTGKKDPLKTDPFPAQWKTVDLSRERRLNLEPGDCELMEGLRDKVLPKLGVKVVAQNISCTPGNLSIQTPQLSVSALVALPKADDSTAADQR
jgi:hypothetical protein